MKLKAKKIRLFGEVLNEGVWIYLVDVKSFKKRVLIYVGKTGWKSVPSETSPWSRLAAHLENTADPSHGLLHYVKQEGYDYNKCVFEISCFGPDLVRRQVEPKLEHEIIQEAEAQLADLLEDAKYPVVGDHEHKTDHADEARRIVHEILATFRPTYLQRLPRPTIT